MVCSYLKIRLLFPLPLLLLWNCSGPAEAVDPPPLDLQVGELTSSQKCGTCHKDIYSVWKTSIHARSASTPVFLEAYDQAVRIAGNTAREACLRCHAPASIVTGNLELSNALNQEGVSCDFCHSLVGNSPDSPTKPFVLDVGTAKYGPVRDASDRGHPVAYSEFHITSEHCAGCHEYQTDEGVPLLSTYSEWLDYQSAGGDKTCQDCHMPLVIANVVDPKILRASGSRVNLHSMPGGHSRAQLVKSLRLRIEEVRRTGETVEVRVSVENSGAGHAVPTGSPSRKVILDIVASAAGGQVASQQYTFQRVAVDSGNEPILDDARMFLETEGIQSDNRIAPGERRDVNTSFVLPTSENVDIRASLTYLYSPHDRPETETRLEFVSDTRQLVSSWTR